GNPERGAIVPAEFQGPSEPSGEYVYELQGKPGGSCHIDRFRDTPCVILDG
ncbi:MAG: hypothetical protein H6Q53_594, partial [Deltaproteobacteria bacterium]|nr:hypothetical protein [Deltaproteobacteria bacterium]